PGLRHARCRHHRLGQPLRPLSSSRCCGGVLVGKFRHAEREFLATQRKNRALSSFPTPEIESAAGGSGPQHRTPTAPLSSPLVFPPRFARPACPRFGAPLAPQVWRAVSVAERAR